VAALSTAGLEAPSTDPLAMWFTGLYCLFGVPVYGVLLASVATLIEEKHTAKVQEFQLRSFGRGDLANLVDKDEAKDGVDFEEFLQIYLVKLGIADESEIRMLRDKFESMDASHDGKLSKVEMEVELAFAEADVSGDGLISFDEFVGLAMKLYEELPEMRYVVTHSHRTHMHPLTLALTLVCVESTMSQSLTTANSRPCSHLIELLHSENEMRREFNQTINESMLRDSEGCLSLTEYAIEFYKSRAIGTAIQRSVGTPMDECDPTSINLNRGDVQRLLELMTLKAGLACTSLAHAESPLSFEQFRMVCEELLEYYSTSGAEDVQVDDRLRTFLDNLHQHLDLPDRDERRNPEITLPIVGYTYLVVDDTLTGAAALRVRYLGDVAGVQTFEEATPPRLGRVFTTTARLHRVQPTEFEVQPRVEGVGADCGSGVDLPMVRGRLVQHEYLYHKFVRASEETESTLVPAGQLHRAFVANALVFKVIAIATVSLDESLDLPPSSPHEELQTMDVEIYDLKKKLARASARRQELVGWDGIETEEFTRLSATYPIYDEAESNFRMYEEAERPDLSRVTPVVGADHLGTGRSMDTTGRSLEEDTKLSARQSVLAPRITNAEDDITPASRRTSSTSGGPPPSPQASTSRIHQSYI
jgi:hypothetical protein